MGFLPSDASVARATGMGMERSAWAGSGCYITGRLLDTSLTCFLFFLFFKFLISVEQVSYWSAPPPHTNVLWSPGSRPHTLTPANVANEAINRDKS